MFKQIFDYFVSYKHKTKRRRKQLRQRRTSFCRALAGPCSDPSPRAPHGGRMRAQQNWASAVKACGPAPTRRDTTSGQAAVFELVADVLGQLSHRHTLYRLPVRRRIGRYP